jgi:glycosyltransferase involved in cell wall biosynthesis
MTNVPVLLIGNFLSGANGSRGVCEELATRLSAHGWAVLTASAKAARIPRLWDMLHTILKWRRSYAVAQVDVFSGLAFCWSEAACAALSWCKKPYVLTLHGGNLPDFARRHPQRVRRLLQSARAVTAPSRYLSEQMAPYREGLRLLPNALVLDDYQFRLRQQIQPSLVWLRAFHEIYNPLLAVKVAQLLAADVPEFRLVMIGPDKGDGTLQRVQSAIAKAGLNERVLCVGQVPKFEVPRWLNESDIFLNTTSVDNAPVSVIEAMACGLCVVSTNVGGLPYLLAHEQDALLVRPNNPPAMAAAVRRLLTEPALAGRLSRHARQTAELHDWNTVLPQWEALLNWAS